MTIIACDGSILATDRMMVQEDLIYSIQKIKLTFKYLFTFTGPYENGLGLIYWLKNGAKIKEWPDWQIKEEEWGHFIVYDRFNKSFSFYEKLPFPQELKPPFAFGSGQLMAIGALEAGASAIKAVEICNKNLSTCGCGIDAIKLATMGWL